MAVIWTERNGIGISNGAPKGPIALYFGTAPGWPVPPTPNQWQSLDLTQFGIPADVLWVELAGILIVTTGTQSVATDELCLSFQTPNPNWGGNPANYLGQCTAQNERDNIACSVEAFNGCIDWAWCRGNPNTGSFPDKFVPAYPMGTAYGFNIAVQKYGH